MSPEAHTIETWDGRTFDYEILLLAIGANAVPAVPGAVTMQGPGYTGRFRTVLRELEKHQVRRVAFALPAATSWPLPLYELALMTAKRVADLGLRKVELSFVTPEAEPLEMFGQKPSAAVRELLEQRGVRLCTGQTPVELAEGKLRVVPGDSIPAERVVSLPRIRGPFLKGLPHDRDGFIPVDSHQYAAQELDVYAAGDATTCPIKQGGVAAQQADAAAESIAALAGAPVEPRPFRPVLRGLLLTGAEPRYMRSDVSGTEETNEVSENSLWWPPGKIAGRYLAPTLALDELDRPPGGLQIEVELGSGAAPAGDRRLHVARG